MWSRMGEVGLALLTISFRRSTVSIELFPCGGASEMFSDGSEVNVFSCGGAVNVFSAMAVRSV